MALKSCQITITCTAKAKSENSRPFFASKALRGRIEKVAHDDKPEVFNQFKGLLYKLNDLVLNTESLLRELLSGLEDRVFKLECSDKTVKKIDRGYQLNLSDTKIETDTLINCSGNGTQSLLETLNISEFNIQNRPLKQIIVDAPQDLNMFAHCLTNLSSTEPRMTITTHQKKIEKSGTSAVSWLPKERIYQTTC